MLFGSACKWTDAKGSVPELNLKTTTVKKLQSLNKRERGNYLQALVEHNLKALRSQIGMVGMQEPCLRMWRIGSDVLPMFTHPCATDFYASVEVKSAIAEQLKLAGRLARILKVRLSFHPGQFVVLGSKNPNVRESSIQELEYHCDMMRQMGFTKWHQDGVAVNVHVGVKDAAILEMRKLLKRETIRNYVTLENDEFSWGVDNIVNTFGDLVPVVIDLHHHWIKEGRKLEASSMLVRDVVDTWRGVRPKLHLAMSDEDLVQSDQRYMDWHPHCVAQYTKSKLRAHSQTAWCKPAILHAGSFTAFDIMYEGKDKNLGARNIRKVLKA